MAASGGGRHRIYGVQRIGSGMGQQQPIGAPSADRRAPGDGGGGAAHQDAVEKHPGCPRCPEPVAKAAERLVRPRPAWGPFMLSRGGGGRGEEGRRHGAGGGKEQVGLQKWRQGIGPPLVRHGTQWSGGEPNCPPQLSPTPPRPLGGIVVTVVTVVAWCQRIRGAAGGQSCSSGNTKGTTREK